MPLQYHTTRADSLNAIRRISKKTLLLAFSVATILPNSAKSIPFPLKPAQLASRSIRTPLPNLSYLHPESLTYRIRGGSKGTEALTKTSATAEDDTAEIEASSDAESTTSSLSMKQAKKGQKQKHVTIMVRTRLLSASSGNVYGHVQQQFFTPHVELLNVAPTKTLASLRSSLTKRLPGRPPMQVIEHASFSSQGRRLDSTLTIQDLLEEEELDEDDDTNNEPLVLDLDVLPPIDDLSNAELIQSLQDDWSLKDLLDAYTANEAALQIQSMQWMKQQQQTTDDQEPMSSVPLLYTQVKDQASLIKESLLQTMSIASKTRLSEEASSSTPSQQHTATDTRRVSTHSFWQPNHVRWTIRTIIASMVLAVIGTSNALAHGIMMYLIPLLLVLRQARPFQIACKTAAYFALRDPMPLIAALVPAPWYSILTIRPGASEGLYGSVSDQQAQMEPIDTEEDFEDDWDVVVGEEEDG